MQIKNVSAYGAKDVPLLRRQGEPFEPDETGAGCLKAGEVVDVSEEHARILLDQVGEYEAADDEAQAIADELAEVKAAVDESEGPPATSAKHAVWIAYAERQGDVDASSKTKKQLVAEYGVHGDEGDPA